MFISFVVVNYLNKFNINFHFQCTAFNFLKTIYRLYKQKFNKNCLRCIRVFVEGLRQ